MLAARQLIMLRITNTGADENDAFLVDPRAGKFVGRTITKYGIDKGSTEEADLVVCSSLDFSEEDFVVPDLISGGSLCAPIGLAKLKGQKNSDDVTKFQIDFMRCD